MDRTHIRQRRFRRHLPYILAAVLVTMAASFLYFKWYDLKYDLQPSRMMNSDHFERLLDGNKRFASGHPRHPGESVEHRNKVAGGQHPFALVVACSDSRVSPELIFDQGLGDIFVVRTAGNMLSDMELGSIQYAVEHLGVRTIVVMGHEHCGAIQALMQDEKVEGPVKTIIDSLQQEVEMQDAIARRDVQAGVVANIQHQVASIMHSPPIAALARQHPMNVKGVIYNLENGMVTRIGEWAGQ
ncbi:MAG TPA: carbonic anhydrase [Phnomibacter sp.]|nr:carbonic anhydrase [Phnomibacter sp.]